jgi:hypothetical protein
MTADEVRRAVAAGSDYTKKTQALAAQMRAVEEQQKALATVLPYIQPELARVQQTLEGVARPDPALLETDPTAYHKAYAQYEHAREEQARLGQLTQLQQQAAERAMAEQVAKANEVLAETYPQWKDPAIRSQWQTEIATWAEGQGYRKEELRRLVDPRQLVTMMKAMSFDRMLKGAKTTAPMAPPPAHGSAPPPAPVQQIQQAEDAFGAKADFRSGAALLAARRANAR